MTSKTYLIVGATGKQGGAVVKALLKLSSNAPTPFSILALTRNAESEGAKSLAAKPNVKVIQGDPTEAETVFRKAGSVDGVFLITSPGKQGDEEKQALSVIDASINHGVKHIVFTSVERGGNEVSETNPTDIEHFASKHRIEKQLLDKTANGKTMWTILRPVAFMDNLTPNFQGKGFAAMWAQIGSKPLQLISSKDIGVFGAMALLEPEKYNGRVIGLAGDELNFDQGLAVFKDATGKDMPQTWGFIGSGLKYMIKELGTMFAWFQTNGYGVDIQALRKEYPQLQDFKTWLKEDSGFSQQ
jgi:uncharacterized protein YbjT (DUF2867 family)